MWTDRGGSASLQAKTVDALFPAEWDEKPSKQPCTTVTVEMGCGTGRQPFPKIEVNSSSYVPLTMRLFQALFVKKDGPGMYLFWIAWLRM